MNLATNLREHNSASQIEIDDILRAVVVLTHVYLEDFLRTLASSFLPFAHNDALNAVPLAGMKDRAKFQLGDLVQHWHKSVEVVIQESVDHLERSTFNSTDDIAALLTKLKFDVSLHSQFFPALDEMIRRHIIVHRADRAVGGAEYKVQPIDAELVMSWVSATHEFMNSVLGHVTAIFHWKRYREIFGDLDVQRSSE